MNEENVVRNDDVENDALDNGQLNDLYDCLADIEILLKTNDSSLVKHDVFSECINKVFKIEMDDLDHIENVICELDKESREAYESLYDIFRSSLLTAYDRYLGITFTYDQINNMPDLVELYSVYKVLYLDETELLAKIYAYIISKNPGIYDIRNDNCFEDILNDDGVFNLDTIPEILNVMDQGNSDYLAVFGEPSSEDDENYVPPKVSIEFDVLVYYFTKSLALGAGVLFKETLRERTLFYMDHIKENNIN